MEHKKNIDVLEIFVAASKMTEAQRQRLLGIAEGILIASPKPKNANE